MKLTKAQLFPCYRAAVLQDGHVDHITGPRCIVKPHEGPFIGRYLVAHTDAVLKEGDEVVYETLGKRARPAGLSALTQEGER